jgi:RHS repeat-associated protein
VLTQTVAGSPAVFTTAVNYVYTDHIDTPRVITQASDNRMRWRSDQADPFGSAAPNQNPASIGVFNYNPRFPGQFYDVESNLHYNYFRDYDPRVGRYVQSDPIGLQGGINTYWYVGGNPAALVDPNGLIGIAGNGSVTVDAYAGPNVDGGREHARHGPGGAYHVHVTDRNGVTVRMSTETWTPLTPKDEERYRQSKQIRNYCESLTDGEKKFLDRVNRQIFHRGYPTPNQALRIGGMRGSSGSGRGQE